MDKAEKGKFILSVAKTLKAYQLGDARIAAYLYASWFVGRAGLFAAALRHAEGVKLQRLTLLAAEEGLYLPELQDRVLPWLENAGLCRVNRRSSGEIESVDSLVLRYESILSAVSDLHEELNPRPEDIGCIHVLNVASRLPTPESEVLHAVARVIGDERAATAVELAKSYNIVAHLEGKGLREPVLFSQWLWGRCIDRAAKALSPLDNTQREIVLDFVERVRAYQGMPEALLRKDAAQNNAEHLLDLAIGVGLLNRTDIQMAGGTSRAFLTSPHFYGDLADEYGEDMFDRVKIFLDSIRNGQHFGSPWTGRILDPEALLRKLIDYGEIGPCTAIGTDYVMSERAGIVTVRRAAPKSSQYVLELVQRDTVGRVLDVVKAGRIEGRHHDMEASDYSDGTRFRSIEQDRAEVGAVPAEMEEAERAIITQLREG